MTRRRLLTALILASLTYPAAHASADVVPYTVDPTLSSLTISGTYEGDPLQPQIGVPNSLTASYTGTIIANRDFAANTLQLTGGTIAAQNNGILSPFDDALADYEFMRPAGSDTNEILKGAIVNFSLSASSLAIGSPSSFDVSQFLTITVSSEIEYADTVQGARVSTLDSLPMTGVLALEPGSATLTEAAGIETLAFPVDTNLAIPLTTSDGGSFPLDIYFSGTIVATASVPEPISLAIFAMPAFILLYRRRPK